jgi:hypothetical protein
MQRARVTAKQTFDKKCTGELEALELIMSPVQVQNKGDGLVQNIGNTLIKVFGSDKLLDALEKEWTYGSTDGVCVESVAGG